MPFINPLRHVMIPEDVRDALVPSESNNLARRIFKLVTPALAAPLALLIMAYVVPAIQAQNQAEAVSELPAGKVLVSTQTEYAQAAADEALAEEAAVAALYEQLSAEGSLTAATNEEVNELISSLKISISERMTHADELTIEATSEDYSSGAGILITGSFSDPVYLNSLAGQGVIKYEADGSVPEGPVSIKQFISIS